MINIVFLLLIFFMMAATIAPPEPLQVTPPAGDGHAAGGDGAEAVLHVGADGALAFGALRGEAALMAAMATADGWLAIRADAALDGSAFAALLARLAAAGQQAAELVVIVP